LASKLNRIGQFEAMSLKIKRFINILNWL